MPKKLPKGVSPDRDRHGNVRLYFRTSGRSKVRLHEIPGTKEFDAEVACARLGVPYKQPEAETPKPETAGEGSFRWLCEQYKRRGKLTPKLLARRSVILDDICESKHKTKKRGALPFALMERKHVLEIRDEIRSTAGAQNEVVKVMSAMFGWAVDAGVAAVNPALRIKRLYSGDGFHSWTVEEFETYKAKHPSGSKARLALYLAMFTGLRREDLSIVGKQHVKAGWLTIRPGKTEKKTGVLVELPILPILQIEMDAGAAGAMTYLESEWKRPFTVNTLGNKMRDWCDQADLPQCSLHGLRKLGATIAAENGATDEELMAIYGWVTKAQSTHYTKKARRKLIAGRAAHKLLFTAEQKMDEVVPPDQPVEESGTKTAEKPNKISA